MMKNTPPFTITIKAADYLAKIIEAVTRLELGTGFKRDIKLHRENRIRSIYSSLAIEGNELSLDEVADVVEGKLVAGKQVDIKEVKNAYEAYDKILTLNPYRVEDFLTAHRLITDCLIKEAGTFRAGDVGVFDGDKAIHLGARPQFVPKLVEELFSWAEVSDLHPVLKSAVLHYEIETIHPFEDGNGRIGRLWQTLVLAKWNEIFAWLPMESVLYEKRPLYYQAIEEARKANDSASFIEFTLSAISEVIAEQQLKQVTPQVKKHLEILTDEISTDSMVKEALPVYDKRYSYTDYITWEGDERWELIDGVPYLMSTPTRYHQEVSGNLHFLIKSFLIGKPCKVYYSPFAVRLNAETFDNTVLQPDLLVICDHDKLDKTGCKGAPDMVVEILSPSTSQYDKTLKFEAYLKAGVIEYWIIDPESKTLAVHILSENNYIIHPYTDEDTVPVHVLDGCDIDMAKVFEA
ncbi:MAG: Uma2 family endonuclease [Oscillospiraceae bacterium]|nr:Uma2 family endonuclease [Oscillospiraceae bacterium]